MENLIFECSDAHSPPNSLSQNFKKWISLGISNGATLVANGDMFDLVVYGHEKYVNSIAVKELITCLSGYQLFLIAGNHDSKKMLNKLNLPSNILIINSLDLDHYGELWHFEHGFTRAADWRFLGRFSEPITNFFTDHFPRQWYWFSKKMGWLSKPEIAGEHEKYNKMVSTVHTSYIMSAEKNKINYCIGHTHKALRFCSWSNGKCVYVLDGGNIRDGSYCVISNCAKEIKWLE
jgi:DNA repair exonuclease SbcCD nuclease subunit